MRQSFFVFRTSKSEKAYRNIWIVSEEINQCIVLKKLRICGIILLIVMTTRTEYQFCAKITINGKKR